MMNPDVIRIAVFGPESTGKTWLAEKLAAHFGAPWVPEYAREFWDAHGGIELGDIPGIAREQWRREDEAAEALRMNCHLLGDSLGNVPSEHAGDCHPIGDITDTTWDGRESEDRGCEGLRARGRLLVCDTEALTTVLWSDLLYGTCPEDIRRGAEKRAKHYALYLLLDTDVPFVSDPQRCFPDPEDREKCRRIWHGALARRRLVYTWIRGAWAERERTAIAAVEEVLKQG